MKKKHFYSFVIALASMAFVACSSDDNEGKQPAGVPDKAKPSTEFTLSNIENEQYADDAVKMDVTTWGNGTAQEFKYLPTAIFLSPSLMLVTHRSAPA